MTKPDPKTFTVFALFNGEAVRRVSEHRTLSGAVRSFARQKMGEGWGARILPNWGNEIMVERVVPADPPAKRARRVYRAWEFCHRNSTEITVTI